MAFRRAEQICTIVNARLWCASHLVKQVCSFHTWCVTQRLTKPPVRERLVETADRLFYKQGIHAVGIDRIIAESGVAKSTMYVHFRTKEDLIAEYLRRRSLHTRQRFSAAVEASGALGSVDRILGVFDELQLVISEPDFRGCAFVNAAAEYPEHEGIQAAIRDDRQWLHGLFENLLKEADKADSPELVYGLIQLYDGANVAAYLDQTARSAVSARKMAKQLLEIHD